ncbi:RNA helicase [Neonectria magnoliae]|uniref:RNA helicase n=1 Tax=Neonectria magnoliae TaxID=2732573 RepID=A0ABR1HPG3_9HYPO
MASSKVPLTITYKKPGTVPPLFLAGSFSDPEWQPKEMEYSTGKDGEHAFHSEVMVKPGEDYQFKLRIGDDWWILAENYAVATDDSGNQNNVITIPRPSPGEEDTPTYRNDSSIDAKADDSSLPIPTPQLRVPEPDNTKETAEELKTPLFAHECLGAYDFEEEESEEEACSSVSPSRDARRSSSDYTSTDVDLNDPTIEKFPSDRTSILDALRTIQTHLGEDQPHVADLPTSPRVVSSSKPNIDSADDMSLSPIPISPNTTRKRENRLSHSSFGRSRSAVSLGSIAEEPKPDTKEPQGPAVISLPNPNTASTHEGPRSPPSEEDEAVVMRSSEANPTDKASKTPLSRDASIEAVPYQARTDLDAAAEGGPAKATNANSKSKDDQRLANSVPLSPEAAEETPSSNTDLGTDTSPDSTPRDSTSSAVAQKRQNFLGKWVRWLLKKMSVNKLPIIVATGALALAIGMGWKGSDK